MAQLATENGVIMLDWVDSVRAMLDGPDALTSIEGEARDILARGIRRVIWAGMGGSVMAVRVLTDIVPPLDGIEILPLDSTDPAALNEIVRRLAQAAGLAPEAISNDPESLRLLLDEVLEVLRARPPMKHVVVTGRNAREELIEAADLVTEMEQIKHPFRSGVKAQVGIEF